ncbi:hypothetical protein Tco_0631725 [Tanacetum coccineum]
MRTVARDGVTFIRDGVRGRGGNDKILDASNRAGVKDGVIPSVTVDSGNATKESVSPSVVDETVAKDKQSPVVDTTGLGSYPPLPTQGTTTAGNIPSKSSYANVVGKLSGTKVNFCTLFTPGGNGIDVVVLVESIRAISERFANTAYGFFLGKRVAYPIVANYVRNTWDKYGLVRSMFSSSTGLFPFNLAPWSSYARAIIELRADVKVKDNIVVTMPKITREGYYTCNIRVKYE